jgi:hypothetical protein
MKTKTIKSFKVIPLGKQKRTVYDIETQDNHNFFGNSLLVHNSNYLSLEEVIEKLGITFADNKAFADWMNMFVDTVIQPMIDTALEDYAYKYGLDNIIKFKREKIIKDMFVVAGKNYALSVVEDDKGNTYYDKPKVGITGIPVKKKTAQKVAQENLPEILDMIMGGCSKEDVVEKLVPLKQEYLTSDANFKDMFIAGRANEIQKFEISPKVIEEDGFRFVTRTPWKVKGALVHNHMLKELKVTSVFPLTDGVMCKTAYVYPNNKYGVNLISWEDKYPIEFEGIFEIDKYTMFEKGVTKMVQKWFDVIGWGALDLEADDENDDLF